MLRIAICDDDVQHRETIAEYVYRWAEEEQHNIFLRVFDNGDLLLSKEKQQQSDIILLDIMMPLLNGMDTAREIRKGNSVVKIIFLTSSPEFAVESYDVKANGYILKPIKYEKLKTVLNDCAEVRPEETEYLIVKTPEGYKKIYLENIEYVEAQNRKVIFNVSGEDPVEVIGKISDYFSSLNEEKGFFKCHRSYIIGLSKIDRFNSKEAVTKSGVAVPIARGTANIFKEVYFDYMFKKERL